jgi:hypothetical protein
MTTSSRQPPPDPHGPAPRGPRQLPNVTSVSSQRVHYDRPRKRLRGLEPVDVTDAVEIVVHTSAELPLHRDVTPVLFVGDVPVRHAERIGPNQYRFFLWDFANVPRGAQIALGWPEDLPEARVRTAFRYEPADPGTRTA